MTSPSRGCCRTSSSTCARVASFAICRWVTPVRRRPCSREASRDARRVALTLTQARDAFAAGEVTSEALVSAAVDQARQYDAEYGLFITPTFEQALASAREADRQR